MSIPVHMRKGENYSGNSFSATYADSVIGAILPYGGATAPYGWFLCQGQAISRTDYSELFEVIGTSFGAGDGSTTFNLPDLRGEFLRGAGNNSHANQGNGGTVGTHQDGTAIPNLYYDSNGGNFALLNEKPDSMSGTTTAPRDIDSSITGNSNLHYVSKSGDATVPSSSSHYFTRPTNTSVNFIIKAKYSASPAGDVLGVQDIRDTLGETPIPSDLGTTVTGALSNIGNRFNYSTEEQVVGKWIDGKPIYRKVFEYNTTITYSPTPVTITVGTIANLDSIVTLRGYDFTNKSLIPRCVVLDTISVTCDIYIVENNAIIIRLYRSDGNQTISKLRIIAEYTKTTD